MKILVSSDQPVLAYGLKTLFKTQLPKITLQIAENNNKAMKMLPKGIYQLAIVTVREGQITSANKILKLLQPTPLLLFCDGIDNNNAQSLHENGAIGILDQKARTDEILIAVQQVMSGMAYIGKSFKQE